MVSSSTVSNDKGSFEQASKDYSTQVASFDSNWLGESHDSLGQKSSEFVTEMGKVVNQLGSFASAAKAYEDYIAEKKKRDSYQASLNSCTDEAEKSKYSAYISSCQEKMDTYSAQIKSDLADVSSFKMPAATPTASISGGAETAAANAGNTSGKEVSTTGGKFVADSTNGLYGHIVIDGKTFYVYRQSKIDGWREQCNRAAAASIASGYESKNWEAVSIAQKSSGGIGSNQSVTQKYFANFGLDAKVTYIGGKYNKIKDDIVSNLTQGNYVMFDLDKARVHGQSGQQWTSSRHWLAGLDIKKVGDDYAIFISDSGHQGSTKDYGLGKGWYKLSEFDGQIIKNFVVISPKK